MNNSDYFSIAALIISIFSLVGSFIFNLRDRMRVRATSKFIPQHPDYDKAHLTVKVVNKGRRVVILTMFGGNLENGGWHGEGLGKLGKGLRLAEQEFHKDKFYKDDIEADSPDSVSNFIDLWFEDSQGRRHKIKNSKKNITLLNETLRKG